VEAAGIELRTVTDVDESRCLFFGFVPRDTPVGSRDVYPSPIKHQSKDCPARQEGKTDKRGVESDPQ
jgi:hypothetical protein